MTDKQDNFGWFRKGLRTRYKPRWQLGQGIIGSAPWIDAVILIVFFLFVSTHTVMQPGVIVELPTADQFGATAVGKTAVIVSHESIGRSGREEMIFFDDEPFSVSSRQHMTKLRRRLSEAARAVPDRPLIVEADVHVRYGTVIILCNMARAAGFEEVNLAEKIAERKISD